MQQAAQYPAAHYSSVQVCDRRLPQRDFAQLCHFTTEAARWARRSRILAPHTCSAHEHRAYAFGQPIRRVEEVQVIQGWDAVRGLGEVSSLATEVFCKSDGFQPVAKIRKLAYEIELYARLGWRVFKLNSCFAVARPAKLQCKQAVVGVLEISLQTDIPSLPAGQHSTAAVVTSMAVLPKLQRQGIGTAMLEAAQQWAASQGAGLLALFVFRDNYAAIRLYERLGFERVAAWVDPRWLTYAEKGVVGPTKRVLYVRQLAEIR